MLTLQISWQQYISMKVSMSAWLKLLELAEQGQLTINSPVQFGIMARDNFVSDMVGLFEHAIEAPRQCGPSWAE